MAKQWTSVILSYLVRFFFPCKKTYFFFLLLSMSLSSLYGRLLQLAYGTFTPPVQMSSLMHESRHPTHILVKNNQCAQNIIWALSGILMQMPLKVLLLKQNVIDFAVDTCFSTQGDTNEKTKKQSSFTHTTHTSWIDLLCRERYVRDGELSGGWASVLLVAFRLGLDILAFVEHSWQRMTHVKRWLLEFRD